jgi:uncharacterized membrane protein (DUF4010 family)
VSSTAVTLNMAHLAREHPVHKELFSAATMLGDDDAARLGDCRCDQYRAVANLSLSLILGALTHALTGSAIAMRAGSERKSSEPLTLKNPLDLPAVLLFGALLAVIMALANGVATWEGAAGAYALAEISGAVDVDAISLSMARLAPDRLDATTAVTDHSHRRRRQQHLEGGAGLRHGRTRFCQAPRARARRHATCRRCGPVDRAAVVNARCLPAAGRRRR